MSLLGETAFSVSAVGYHWSDVVAWAECTGQWERLDREVRSGLARTAHAAVLGALPDQVELRQAARLFRYERRLVAADDLARWLERWGMTSSDWVTWLQHQLLADRFSDPPTRLRPNTLAAAEVEPLLWPTGVCSGRLSQWARELAGRVAVTATSGLGPASAPLDGKACSALESRYAEFCASAATPAAIEAAIAGNVQEWTRLEYQSLLFASVDTAQEARLCALEDGARTDVLARRAGTSVVHESVLAEQLDIDLKRLLVSAVPGDVLGPLAVHAGFVIVVLIDKELPTPTHSPVAHRARLEVTEHAVKRALDDSVRWSEPL